MDELKITSKFTIFSNSDELSKSDKELLLKAVDARKNAYAPYSHFRVGASVLLENGEIHSGNNQENAAYPSGLCAERVALFSVAANFPGIPIKAIAIAAKPEQFELTEPITPCGACRQVIAEYELLQGKKIEIIMDAGNKMILKSTGIENLLPLAFYNEKLKKEKK